MTERVRMGIRPRDIHQKYTDYSGDPDDGARMKGEVEMDLYDNGNGFRKERNVPVRSTQREENYSITRQDFDDGILAIRRKQEKKKAVKTAGIVAGSIALLGLSAWAGHRFWPGE